MGVDGWDGWVVGWVGGWMDELEPPATPHPLTPSPITTSPQSSELELELRELLAVAQGELMAVAQVLRLTEHCRAHFSLALTDAYCTVL